MGAMIAKIPNPGQAILHESDPPRAAGRFNAQLRLRGISVNDASQAVGPHPTKDNRRRSDAGFGDFSIQSAAIQSALQPITCGWTIPCLKASM